MKLSKIFSVVLLLTSLCSFAGSRNDLIRDARTVVKRLQHNNEITFDQMSAVNYHLQELLSILEPPLPYLKDIIMGMVQAGESDHEKKLILYSAMNSVKEMGISSGVNTTGCLNSGGFYCLKRLLDQHGSELKADMDQAGKTILMACGERTASTYGDDLLLRKINTNCFRAGVDASGYDTLIAIVDECLAREVTSSDYYKVAPKRCLNNAFKGFFNYDHTL